jgi:hypothetical protein
MERFIKLHFQGAEADGVSAIQPNEYRERFYYYDFYLFNYYYYIFCFY